MVAQHSSIELQNIVEVDKVEKLVFTAALM